MSKIYIVKNGDNYKIGISDNPNNRLRQLKSGNPYHIELIYSQECKNARAVEKHLHRIFKQKRISREWFSLTENELSEAISIIGSMFGKNDIDISTPMPDGEGWRKERVARGKYWVWRRGSHENRESRYGGKL